MKMKDFPHMQHRGTRKTKMKLVGNCQSNLTLHATTKRDKNLCIFRWWNLNTLFSILQDNSVACCLFISLDLMLVKL